MREGDKVVCVGTFNPSIKYPDELCPKKGEIYTIRDVLKIGPSIGLFLEEIKNPDNRSFCDGHGEISFDAAGFRPIDYSFGEEVIESIVKQVEQLTEPIEI